MLHTFRHREAEAVGLAGAVVRVLPQDNHLHLIKGRGVQGVEDEAPARVDAGVGLTALLEKAAQLLHVRLVELADETVLPAFLQLDGITHGLCLLAFDDFLEMVGALGINDVEECSQHGFIKLAFIITDDVERFGDGFALTVSAWGNQGA